MSGTSKGVLVNSMYTHMCIVHLQMNIEVHIYMIHLHMLHSPSTPNPHPHLLIDIHIDIDTDTTTYTNITICKYKNGKFLSWIIICWCFPHRFPLILFRVNCAWNGLPEFHYLQRTYSPSLKCHTMLHGCWIIFSHKELNLSWWFGLSTF